MGVSALIHDSDVDWLIVLLLSIYTMIGLAVKLVVMHVIYFIFIYTLILGNGSN